MAEACTLNPEYIRDRGTVLTADVAASGNELVYLYVSESIPDVGVCAFVGPDAAERLAEQILAAVADVRARYPKEG